MRQLLDLTNESDIGIVDWEFIHDMQGLVPDLITPVKIMLTKVFLNSIPGKWDKIKRMLAPHVKQDQTVYVAISDLENLGNEFKAKGTIKNKKGDFLGFHRVVIYDKDRFEDDYIGAVISDKEGNFSLSFGKKTFSDFGIEAEPDIYFKVYFFKDGEFYQMGKVMPEVLERSETNDGHIIYEFGVITV